MRKLVLVILAISCFNSYSRASGPVDHKREIENLATFAKLYGYVRYFYPGDEVASINWDKFALYAVPRITTAKDNTTLKNRLDSLFLPIAPGMRISFKEKEEPFDVKKLLPEDTSGLCEVSWQHLGLGLHPKSLYASQRVNRDVDPIDRFGSLVLMLPANPYRGKSIRIRAAIKSDGARKKFQASLWLRIGRQNNRSRFISKPANTKSKDWNYYEINADVFSDASYIKFGCIIQGKGQLWLDDLQLLYQDDKGNWVPSHDFDGSFENVPDGRQPDLFQSLFTSYDMYVTSSTAANGSKSLEMDCVNGLFRQRTHLGDYIHEDIGQDLSCMVPLCLPASKTHTYPRPGRDYKSIRNAINDISYPYDSANLTARLADVIMFWNVFEHFYPYFEYVSADWQAALPHMLNDAWNTKSDQKFIQVLLKYQALLNDGHGNIINKNKASKTPYYPAVTCAQVEGRMVVTKSNDPFIHPGDIITAIDGVDSKFLLDSVKRYVAGATEASRTFKTIRRILSGAQGTILTFEIDRQDGLPQKVTCKRTVSKTGYDNHFSPNSLHIKEIDSGIYYVNLSNVTGHEIDSLSDQFAKAQSIILDMRGYPFRVGYKFLEYLIKQPDTASHIFNIPEIIRPDHQFAAMDASGWRMEPLKPHWNAKIIYLIDERAISAAESYSGFIEGYKLGTIVGQPTAGTNGNVNPFDLIGGYNVTWTGMKVVKLNGSQHFGVGIIPDVYVSRTIKGVREGRDEILEKALELAKQH